MAKRKEREELYGFVFIKNFSDCCKAGEYFTGSSAKNVENFVDTTFYPCYDSFCNKIIA
jgi:hypothetical protein